MKIVSLTSENVKRLTAVHIEPNGNMVPIVGRNGQGKTSVLDSIWWAIAGAGNVQAVPIRKGQSEAKIKLDLGDIVVTRTFKDRDGETTTQLVVENGDGARYPSPQKMLDALLGSLTFDPLAFTRMDPRKQFDALRQFVPGIDFDEIELANKNDYAQRTNINRQAKEARAAGERIDVPPQLPDAEVDEDALVAQLEDAGKHNATIETRKERRASALEQIAGHRAEAQRITASVDAEKTKASHAATRAAVDVETQIEQLEAQLKRLKARATAIADDLIAEHARIEREFAAQAQKHTDQADELQAKIDGAGDLPAPIDTAKIRAAIDGARSINAGIAMREQRFAHIKRAEELEAASKDLTAAMEKREADKHAAIAAAKLPVAGLGFGDGQVLLQSLPFNQASDAEQLRASIAIAMASNPKLRVIRVRDGSILDENGLRLLGQMADEYDCQVWCELVRDGGEVGFIIEDGHLKAAKQPDLLSAAE